MEKRYRSNESTVSGDGAPEGIAPSGSSDPLQRLARMNNGMERVIEQTLSGNSAEFLEQVKQVGGQ